jgi:hypothetical protein
MTYPMVALRVALLYFGWENDVRNGDRGVVKRGVLQIYLKCFYIGKFEVS